MIMRTPPIIVWLSNRPPSRSTARHINLALLPSWLSEARVGGRLCSTVSSNAVGLVPNDTWIVPPGLPSKAMNARVSNSSATSVSWLATGQGSHCRTAVQVIASPLTVAKKAHWRRRLSPNSMVRYRVARPGGVKTDGGGTNATASLVVVPSAAIKVPFRSL